MQIGRSFFILLLLNAALLYNAEFSANFFLHSLLPANLVFVAAYVLIELVRKKLAKYQGQDQDIPLDRGALLRQKQELLHKLQDISQAIVIPAEIKQQLEEKYQTEYAQIGQYAQKNRRSPQYVFISFLLNSLLEMESKELDLGSVDKATQLRSVYQRLLEYDKSNSGA